MNSKELKAASIDLNACGWIGNLPSSKYFGAPHVGSSALKNVLVSPAYYLEKKQNPDPTSEAQLLGSAFHCLLLEPHLFDDTYCVKPLGTDRRTKDGKAAYEKWTAANAGKTELNHETMETVKAMVDRCQSHANLKSLLDKSTKEVSFFSPYDEYVGMKARADAYIPSHGMVLDFKTCKSANAKEFGKDIANYQYHLQAAYYTDVIKATKEEANFFVFVAVEKTRPYQIALYVLDQKSISEGRALYTSALKTLSECTKTNNFPSYSEKVQEISIPVWALNNYQVSEF